MIFLHRESPTMAKDASEDLTSCVVVTDPEVGKWSRGVCVGPAEPTRNRDTDFHAFSLSPEEELYLDFIPSAVTRKLNDKANWNDRLSAIGEIERILTQNSSCMSDFDLKSVVGLVLMAVGDSQLTVSQRGLQVMEILLGLVGKRIVPNLIPISTKLLARLGSNRRNVKIKAIIMGLFRTLMDIAGPTTVLSAISKHGLQNKNSRVREESVNVVIVALLHYQNGEIQLLHVANDIVQAMADSRAKVRQAAFEAIALVSSQLVDGDLRHIVSMIVELHRSQSSQLNRLKAPLSDDLNLVDAFHSRIARKSVPKLDNQGLVQYSVPVLKPSVEMYSGPDVDWISAGSGSSASAQHLQDSPPQPIQTSQSAQLNTVAPPPSSFRPYRSAGKRPWETEAKQEVSISAPPQFTPTSNAPPITVPASSSFSTTSSTTGSKKLPATTYVELHFSKLKKAPAPAAAAGGSGGGVVYNTTTVVPKSQYPAPVVRKSSLGNLIGAAGTSSGSGGGVGSSNEKPSSVLTSNSEHPKSLNSQPPLPEGSILVGDRESNLPVVVQHPSDEHLVESHAAMGTANPMSMTWPRSNLGSLNGSGSGGGGLNSVLPLKGPTQINADAQGVAGVQSTVKTSFSRPPSKPRVRNPLTSLKSHGQGHGISPPLSGIPIPNIGSSQRSSDSPTTLEREFLFSGGSMDVGGGGRGPGHAPPSWGEGGGGGGGEEDYFTMIPEDTAILDSSLTSSLSSLCGGMKDLEHSPDVDKLKFIRKEAASRKAQFLSTSASATNSPESPRHTSTCAVDHAPPKVPMDLPPKLPLSTPTKVLKPAKKPPPPQMMDLKTGPYLNKWNALDAYGGTGRDVKEEKTYSQAFAKKLLNTTNKPAAHKGNSSVQGKKEREKGAFLSSAGGHGTDEPDSTVLSFSIALEGHGLDHGEGSGGKDTQQTKKKAKKSDSNQSLGKNRTTMNSSLFGGQEGGNARPTIERGGTNTISMEVSGVGSRATPPSQSPSLLSQTTKESFFHKKQKIQSSEEEGGGDQGKKLRSPVHSNSAKKPPLPADTSEKSLSNVTSAPVETGHRRSKHRRHINDGRTNSKFLEVSSQEPPRGKAFSGSGRSPLDLVESSPGGGSGGSPMELDNALLENQVHSNPDQAVRTALQSMASGDWNSKCEGMGMVMCVARNYPHLLQTQLHTVLLAINKEVKNLRSSVAKKAIECLALLFNTMKRAMEPDIDTVVQVLLHKGGEANAFLREVVEKAMSEMISNVSPSKALSSLILGGMSQRNMHVRRIMAKFICGVIESFEPSKFLHASREMVDKALSTVLQLCKDSSPDARYYARKSLSKLVEEPDFQQVVSRLKGTYVADSKDVIETLRTRGIGEPPSDSSAKGIVVSGGSSRHHTSHGSLRTSANSTPQKDPQDLSPRLDSNNNRYSSSGSNASSMDSHRKSRRHHHSHHHNHNSHHNHEGPPQQEVALPDGLVERMQASSWSERDEAITELEKYVLATLPQTLTPQLQKVLEAFYLRLTDRNSKVNLHALQAFSSMVPVLQSTLVPMISNIMGTLIPNLASCHVTIHATAMRVLELMSKHINAIHLIPTVASSSQFSNSRVQPIMTKILAGLTVSAFSQKPQMVNRLVLPVVWHHVKSKMPVTGEAKVALLQLCKSLLDCMGQSFIDSASHLSVEDYRKFEALLEQCSDRGSSNR